MLNKLLPILLSATLFACVSPQQTAQNDQQASCEQSALTGSHVNKKVCVPVQSKEEKLRLSTAKALLTKGQGESMARVGR